MGVIRDVCYRDGAAGGSAECALDLYVPDAPTATGAGSRPVLVWFHGGGLVEGSREGNAPLAARLAERGVIVANADYRVHPAVTYPTYVEDAAAAVAWADRWAAGPEGAAAGAGGSALFVGGHSAGAYLAAMVAMDPRYLAAAGVAAGGVAGCVGVSGQTLTHATVRAERGLPPHALVADEASPLYHVRPDAPPLLLLVAENDLPARREEAQLLCAALTEGAGSRTTRLMIVPGRDHGSVGSDLLTPGDPGGPALLAFLAEFGAPGESR